VRDGANQIGPNLYDVFGRRAGTLPGFAYTDALKVSKIVWNADTLDKVDPKELAQDSAAVAALAWILADN